MTKYVEIFWTPVTKTQDTNWEKVLFLPPKPFFPFLQKHRAGSLYLKCPAMIETTRNDFVVLAPFNLEIRTDAEGNIKTNNYGQTFFDQTIVQRSNDFGRGFPVMASLPPRYIFFCKENVEMEIRDLPLIVNESNKNFKVVGGRFNISKWHRPIDLSVEFVNNDLPINMRTEDGLYLVRFITPNNVPVKLTRTTNQDIRKSVEACTSVKLFRPDLGLVKSYEMASEYIAAFWKGMKQ